ncbi:MAG: hypothetical protein MK077_05720 [Phycisphaerales bacterium]|nr:hypothetical protein [Phycisphaerales bacterium]
MSEHITPTEGLTVQCAEDATLKQEALRRAMDYRGDVTLVTRDGSATTGYLFDLTANGQARLDLPDGSERRQIAIDDVIEVRFSGKDTAAGKSFDRWIQRYIEKTLAGEEASIESESLD